MSDRAADRADEAKRVATATEVLARHNIPATSREFRLRQEFFRHGWDVRVRDDGGIWSVRAVKPERADIDVHAATEGDVLRLALAQVFTNDEAARST